MNTLPNFVKKKTFFLNNHKYGDDGKPRLCITKLLLSESMEIYNRNLSQNCVVNNLYLALVSPH
jgi:hypothetical protein